MIRALRTSWIGVDLGAHAVKLAQVERHGGKLRLAGATVIPRRVPWPANHQALPADSSMEVAAGLALGDFRRPRLAACTLPMHLCGLQMMHIPPGDDADRRAAIEDELQSRRELATERSFDFWETATSDLAAQRENVAVLTLPGAWTTQVVADMQSAGLQCQVLDGLPLATARATQLVVPEASEEVVATVDWGYHSALFCVVQHGRPLFVRTLRDSGLAGMLQALCDMLGVDVTEAQLLLRQHGLPLQRNRDDEPATAVQHALVEVVTESLLQMSDELERTLSYLKVHRPAPRPERLLLLGGGGTIRNLDRWLSDKIGLPVSRWRLEPSQLKHDELRDLPLEMLAPAIGLSCLTWSSP